MMHNQTTKQSLLFITTVLLIVLLAPYLGKGTNLLWAFYRWGHGLLAPLFSSSGLGHIILGILSLGLVPLIIAAIPSLIYWLLAKKQWPYFWSLVWAVLLIVATLLIGHA